MNEQTKLPNAAYPRGSRLVLFAALLGLACGRTELGLWTVGDAGAGAVAGAGAASGAGTAAGAGAASGAAAVSAGGAPGSSGGAPSGGPDFDFTPTLDQATAYQVHPSHSGSQQSVTITPPLTRIWTLRFDELVSYPIMAESRVFVALNTTVALTESVVQALDAASGAVLWSSTIHASVTFSPVMLAYDRGLLFVATESCDVLALEPATGKVRWQTTLATTAPSDAIPIAAGGAVMLVGAAGPDERALYVIDEHDGSLVYSVVLPVGGDPTLGGGRIYVTGTRDETAAVDAATGNIEWSTSATSNLVSGRAGSVIHDGVLWLRPTEDGIRAVDAASGSTLGKLEDPSPAYMPSAAESQLVLPSVVPTNALRVFGATSGAFRWQVALPARPVLPALTTPDTVYVLAGTDDKFLYGVDLVRRQFSWQSSEPAAPAEMLDPGEHPLPQGMAASGGRIVVAYGHWLSAFAASN